ncbi:hypothetical protein N9V30_01750 [Candidatus Poseidoniales archaeon]|nr:hypothetical protein [Candidatus Poseidoniales archaeon]
MFCSSCGSLGYYLPNGNLQCKRCDNIDKETKQIELITGECINLSELKTSTAEPEERSYDVIMKLKLPTTDAYFCPECHGNESTCELRQMDQTDEPEVAFLECQICGHGWREG